MVDVIKESIIDLNALLSTVPLSAFTGDRDYIHFSCSSRLLDADA